MDRPDTIIIGGGLMGSATAWQLTRAGKKVLLLESQGPIYDRGSSFGNSRITRSLGVEGDVFSLYHNSAVGETQELIDWLRKHEKAANHRLEDIYTTSPVTYIHYRDVKPDVESILKNQKDTIEHAASNIDAYEKFGMTVPENASVIREFKANSGKMNPAVLINKLHTAIQLSGSKVQYNSLVTNITRSKNGYDIDIRSSIQDETTSISADQIVLAGGPYNPELLQKLSGQVDQNPAHHIEPKRVFLGFMTIKSATYSQLSTLHKQKIAEYFPVIDYSHEFMFGMIDRFDPEGKPVFKIGGHLIRQPITDLDAVWRIPLSQEEISWCMKNMLQYLKSLNIPVDRFDLDYIEGYSCVYSMTENETPIIDYVQNAKGKPDKNAVLIGGMSGVGAKGSMCYGSMAAKLLTK